MAQSHLRVENAAVPHNVAAVVKKRRKAHHFVAVATPRICPVGEQEITPVTHTAMETADPSDERSATYRTKAAEARDN